MSASVGAHKLYVMNQNLEFKANARYLRSVPKNGGFLHVYALTNLTAQAKDAYKASKGWKSAQEPGYYREDNTGNPLFMTSFNTLGPNGGTVVISRVDASSPWRSFPDRTEEIFFGAGSWNPLLQQAIAVEQAKQQVGTNRGFGQRMAVNTTATTGTDAANADLSAEPQLSQAELDAMAADAAKTPAAEANANAEQPNIPA